VDRFEPNVRIPGPTALPSSVRTAGSRQMINHRSAEFEAILGRIISGVRPFFGTNGDVAVLTASGTGGLEAAIVNTLSPGDRVLGVSIGAFGDRFAAVAAAYGADVVKLDVPWGQAADSATVREAVRTQGPFVAVLLTHNETSTGVTNPVDELCRAIHETSPQTLILVDTVSGVGALPFEMDSWGVDVAVAGSQKAWMAAPGLAMVAASDRAWAAMETARMPRFYLDLRKHRDSGRNGQTPWTPAIAVAFQVDDGIRLMQDEGKEAVFARHRACAAATRAGLLELGFTLFGDSDRASDTVTCVRIPAAIDWNSVNGYLKQHGVQLAGGQGKLQGAVFRVGHLGSVTVEEILGVFSTLEAALSENGQEVTLGASVRAAQVAALRSSSARQPVASFR
jgi:aspartate aminotransferase-like enzyme